MWFRVVGGDGGVCISNDSNGEKGIGLSNNKMEELLEFGDWFNVGEWEELMKIYRF